MLLRDGHVTRSALGVRIRDVRDLSPEDKTALKLADDKGVVVEDVAAGGPSAKAGLAAGDVILQFDGQPVDRSTHLQWMASTAGVGRTVPVKVLRDGKNVDLKVTLGQLPEPPRK
jgi:serine protease Do